ncbi:hypothetical protein Acr_05g0012260 [Actinidia rufa]|uniref:Uncharacterized protein n=1 Tax=Actinidia rufa TaxID=165716 RepID=A0A7J0EPU6_9ERIC|nr:hypothetical protein Acr_05g0012260 [Actinidia rufa]
MVPNQLGYKVVIMSLVQPKVHVWRTHLNLDPSSIGLGFVDLKLGGGLGDFGDGLVKKLEEPKGQNAVSAGRITDAIGCASAILKPRSWLSEANSNGFASNVADQSEKKASSGVQPRIVLLRDCKLVEGGLMFLISVFAPKSEFLTVLPFSWN